MDDLLFLTLIRAVHSVSAISIAFIHMVVAFGIFVDCLSLFDHSFGLREHPLNFLGLLGMLEDSLALEIVEAVRDTLASLLSKFMLLLKSLLHELLVLVALDQL